MKIGKIETIYSQLDETHHPLYVDVRQEIFEAIAQIVWPVGSEQFLIYPESGKKRGQGNGVKPIKSSFLNYLEYGGWETELKVRAKNRKQFGGIDAVLIRENCVTGIEWETGNISSSHRSLNKLCLFIKKQIIQIGFLVVPRRNMAQYLTDRIGNFEELEAYFEFWESALNGCNGVLEIIGIEHDDTSLEVPRIPKGTDGRAIF